MKLHELEIGKVYKVKPRGEHWNLVVLFEGKPSPREYRFTDYDKERTFQKDDLVNSDFELIGEQMAEPTRNYLKGKTIKSIRPPENYGGGVILNLTNGYSIEISSDLDSYDDVLQMRWVGGDSDAD